MPSQYNYELDSLRSSLMSSMGQRPYSLVTNRSADIVAIGFNRWPLAMNWQDLRRVKSFKEKKKC